MKPTFIIFIYKKKLLVFSLENNVRTFYKTSTCIHLQTSSIITQRSFCTRKALKDNLTKILFLNFAHPSETQRIHANTKLLIIDIQTFSSHNKLNNDKRKCVHL